MEGSEACPICHGIIEDGGAKTSELTKKGCEKINQISTQRDDNIEAKPGQRVHQHCRKAYTSPKGAKRDVEKEVDVERRNERPLKRSVERSFDFKADCFYCGTIIDKKSKDVYDVTCIEAKETLLGVCEMRGDD